MLEEVLASPYLEHFALLVCSIHTLLCDDLREDDVETSQKALDDFCSGMESLYGKIKLLEGSIFIARNLKKRLKLT